MRELGTENMGEMEHTGGAVIGAPTVGLDQASRHDFIRDEAMQGIGGIILDGNRTDAPGLVLVPMETISTVPAMNWCCSIGLESRITETNIDVRISGTQPPLCLSVSGILRSINTESIFYGFRSNSRDLSIVHYKNSIP